jgi:hypothetical protein
LVTFLVMMLGNGVLAGSLVCSVGLDWRSLFSRLTSMLLLMYGRRVRHSVCGVFRISSRFFVATGSTDKYSFSFAHGYSLQWAQVFTFLSRAHGLISQSFRQKPEIVSDLHPWQSTSSGLNLISPWSDQCLAICFFHSRSFV